MIMTVSELLQQLGIAFDPNSSENCNKEIFYQGIDRGRITLSVDVKPEAVVLHPFITIIGSDPT